MNIVGNCSCRLVSADRRRAAAAYRLFGGFEIERHSRCLVGLKALPQGGGGRSGAVSRIASGWRTGPDSVVGIGRQTVNIGGLGLVVLDVAIKEGGDEMRLDRHQPVLAPHRILEPVEVPEGSAHFRRRADQRYTVRRFA